MLGPVDDRTPPMTPQLALRVAMIGGIALLLFAIIFFRLWFLQVLSGTRYVAEAQSNVVAHEPVAAARGEIVDSSGTPLVQSVAVPSIQIDPRHLPVPVTLDTGASPAVTVPAGDQPLLNRLASLIGMSRTPRACRYTVYWAHKLPSHYDVPLSPISCLIAKSVSQSPYADAAIKTNVPAAIQDYIAERPTEFKGVLYQDTYIRKYALDTAGAQVFGTYGQITAKEVGTKPYKGIEQGNVVGQSGLEEAYNWALQGVNGEQGIKVNSQGEFEGYAKETKPTPGDTLKLSISAPLEKVGQRALWHSMQVNGGTSGAFIAMNPVNGQVYAMGSSPSYNPAKVSPTITDKELKLLDATSSNQPFDNRATQGALPDGSTFKPVTAVAALESGDWGVDQLYDDIGKFCAGTFCPRNSGGAAYGPVNLETAIEVSDDVYFYHLGDLLGFDPKLHPDGGPLQQWASKFGLGHTTGVDLPAESRGEIGSPNLVAALWKQERECDKATGLYKGHKKHPAVLGQYGDSIVSGGCGIDSASYWTIGDNIETGVGQFDDEVTPIQLAVVYAAIENGGTIVTPHIGDEIMSPAGGVIQKVDPANKGNLHINPAYLDAIRTGLNLAAQGPSGTSTSVMGNFGKPVYGKTGTAELGDSSTSPDHAWYAAYVPDAKRPIVVVVNVEKGGFGAVAAAPVAREILSQWFYGKPGPYVAGQSSGNQF
ncbi:MAG TPA: penicillin-binding transpeptidase domain-containing protein [Solirubrobacteraceae bacterium]|jgi:penicillin-binding protein 2|nr:penicillin-binding transpeptidase domain-containing protein [Solirubrobacteraceae bacterium]